MAPKLDVADEFEWVFASCGADCDDWVVTDGDEGLVSGVFRSSPNHRGEGCLFLPFGREPRAVVIPFSAGVVSASHRGRLLLSCAWSTYAVCNPVNADWIPLPKPSWPRCHTVPSAVALVVSASDPSHFHAVCVFEDRIETYSSLFGKWSAYDCSPSGVVPNSGVGAAGFAYFRTSVPGLLAFDPNSGDLRRLPAPPCIASEGEWGVGEARGRLCCTCVPRDGNEVSLYGLGDGDVWEKLGSLGFVIVVPDDGADVARKGEWIGRVGEPPRPLRFESEGLEVVLRVDGRVVAVDLESKWARWAHHHGGSGRELDADYVAYTKAVPSI